MSGERGPVDRPSRTGMGLALLGGVLASVPLIASRPALLPGTLGLTVFAAGLAYGSRPGVTLGAAGLFSGVLIAGVLGAPPEVLLLSTAALVIAWDVAENAIGLGEQLGRTADTRQAELVHAAGSAIVAAGGATFAYVTFRAVGGTQPAAALVLLMFGGVMLASSLRG